MMSRIIIIIFLIFMFAGAMMKLEGRVTEEGMENLTIKMSYDNYNYSKLSEKGNNENITFIPRLIYKYADFIMFAGVEGAKVGLGFGYNNPDYNFGFAWKLMFISMFAFLIIPLIYVLLFIGYGIYIVINWIKKKIKVKGGIEDEGKG